MTKRKRGRPSYINVYVMPDGQLGRDRVACHTRIGAIRRAARLKTEQFKPAYRIRVRWYLEPRA